MLSGWRRLRDLMGLPTEIIVSRWSSGVPTGRSKQRAERQHSFCAMGASKYSRRFILDISAIGNYRAELSLQSGSREVHVYFTLRRRNCCCQPCLACVADDRVFACIRRDGLHCAGESEILQLCASDGFAADADSWPATPRRTASNILCADAGSGDAGAQGKLCSDHRRSETRQRGLPSPRSGGGNVSNVGIWGGKNNDVGVWQGGRDLSNINLINTQGMAVAVIQPPGSAPLNMLIARLPNGALLIKR